MENLTNQEKEVLELLAEELRNIEIAEKLNLHFSEVRQILERIYRKLGVSNRVQAATIAIRRVD